MMGYKDKPFIMTNQAKKKYFVTDLCDEKVSFLGRKKHP